MKKHLIAWGILSTMFMANTFAQKDIDRPIMGWSSWNTYHVNISEELIKQQADALIKHGLKEAGYNTNRLRKEKLLSEGVIQSLRENKYIALQNISKICELLNCQPGDLLEYVPEDVQ